MSLFDNTNEDFVTCVYVADDPEGYLVRLKRYRQIAGGFEVYDPAGPQIEPIGSGMQMRVLHFVNTNNGKRTTLPWASKDSQYDSTSPITISIDGVAGWKSTGRRGETVTY